MIARILTATGLCYPYGDGVRINTAMVAIVIVSALACLVLS